MILIERGAPAPYKEKPAESEADIQRRIANWLESLGFEVMLEVRISTPWLDTKTCVIDIVSFYEKIPVFAVEVKTRKGNKNGCKKHLMKQQMLMAWLYNHGVVSCIATSIDDCKPYIKEIKANPRFS